MGLDADAFSRDSADVHGSWHRRNSDGVTLNKKSPALRPGARYERLPVQQYCALW
jgi:hypothetical protein